MKYSCALKGSSPSSSVMRREVPSGNTSKPLLVVHDVPQHDLTQHLLMHSGVVIAHGLDASVEIARHDVGRADIDDRLVGRQPWPLPKQ